MHHTFYKTGTIMAPADKCLSHFDQDINENSCRYGELVGFGNTIELCNHSLASHPIKLSECELIMNQGYHRSKHFLLNIQRYYECHEDIYAKDLSFEVFAKLLSFDNFEIAIDSFAQCNVLIKDDEIRKQYKNEISIMKDMFIIVYYMEIYDYLSGRYEIL